jgi:hypothetical protein
MKMIIVCTSTKTFSQMMLWKPSKLKIRKTIETNMMPEVTANTTLNLEKKHHPRVTSSGGWYWFLDLRRLQ